MALKYIFYFTATLLITENVGNLTFENQLVTDSHVNSIEVFTSNCDDCGVGVFGEISVKLCGNGPLECCVTGALNHLIENDFRPGESNLFDGSFIGECDGFDLGDESLINLNNIMTLYHNGMDGGKFDWVKVRTSGGNIFHCNFYQFLDNNSHELGSECRIN